jgi:hypothetical protein
LRVVRAAVASIAAAAGLHLPGWRQPDLQQSSLSARGGEASIRFSLTDLQFR